MKFSFLFAIKQRNILRKGNSYDIYDFAQRYKEADIEKLSKRLANLNDAKYCYLFAKNIAGANIEVLEKIVLESKDPNLCYLFARDIPGADIEAHQKVVLESKDPKICYLFAKNITGADLEAHQKVVLESKDQKLCYLYAKDINGADIYEHEKVVLKSKDPKICYLFARDIAGADIEAHQKVVLESKDPKICYWFAKHMAHKGADLIKIYNLILEIGDPEYCYWFARDIDKIFGFNLSQAEDMKKSIKYRENLYKRFLDKCDKTSVEGKKRFSNFETMMHYYRGLNITQGVTKTILSLVPKSGPYAKQYIKAMQKVLSEEKLLRETLDKLDVYEKADILLKKMVEIFNNYNKDGKDM